MAICHSRRLRPPAAMTGNLQYAISQKSGGEVSGAIYSVPGMPYDCMHWRNGVLGGDSARLYRTSILDASYGRYADSRRILFRVSPETGSTAYFQHGAKAA